MRGRRRRLVGLTIALYLVSAPIPFAAPTAAELPVRLADTEYWALVDDLSEPGGFFNSDNLISNEDLYQTVVPELARVVAPGGVYIGVGPDQNFTYIAASDPAVAFIADLRRGNLHVHLMYKALFALSADRREFLSRLFGRSVPADLAGDASVGTLLAAFAGVVPEQAVYDDTRRAVIEMLTRHRGAPLEPADAAGIEFVLRSFFTAGPDLTFVSGGGYRRSRYPSYAALQTATDNEGVERGYLAAEPAFQRVKSLQARNLVIPVVGNFAGPKAIQAIGRWVRARAGVVTVFYTSNVEQYLFQDAAWDRFRQNVATLPIDGSSTFIRSCFNTCTQPGGSRAVTLLDSIPRLLDSAATGRIQTYWDVLAHSRYP